jgi:hypothetical protein
LASTLISRHCGLREGARNSILRGKFEWASLSPRGKLVQVIYYITLLQSKPKNATT